MTESQAAEILAAHNAWRRQRSDDELPSLPMQDPLDVGRAIDVAVRALAAHEAAKPAEPWGYANRRDGQAWSHVVLEGWHAHNIARYDLPLYAAPVAAASPLTPSQVHELCDECHLDWHRGWSIDDEPNRLLQLARAIEAHHGIKEKP